MVAFVSTRRASFVPCNDLLMVDHIIRMYDGKTAVAHVALLCHLASYINLHFALSVKL